MKTLIILILSGIVLATFTVGWTLRGMVDKVNIPWHMVVVNKHNETPAEPRSEGRKLIFSSQTYSPLHPDETIVQSIQLFDQHHVIEVECRPLHTWAAPPETK